MGNAVSAGLHLTMDGYVKDTSVFTKENIESMFAKVIAALEMKALDKPQVYEVPVDPEVLRRVELTGNFEDEGGITAVVVISTSHLAVHCWPLQKFFSLDVFSCKTFDAMRAKEVIHEAFGISAVSLRVNERLKPMRTPHEAF